MLQQQGQTKADRDQDGPNAQAIAAETTGIPKRAGNRAAREVNREDAKDHGNDLCESGGRPGVGVVIYAGGIVIRAVEVWCRFRAMSGFVAV